jgi:hypothetical protein
MAVARDPRNLRRLARDLAALSPDERAQVIAKATRARLRPLLKGFAPPVLSGGTRWIGGDLLAKTYTATMAADPVFVVLTRQPVEGRAFSTDEALAALGTWLSACVAFEDNEAVLWELLELVSPSRREGQADPRREHRRDNAGERSSGSPRSTCGLRPVRGRDRGRRLVS